MPPSETIRRTNLLRLIRWLLLPLGLLHLATVWLRNKGYDWHLFSVRRLPLPVISVGNIQLGGTAKTPVVIALLKIIQARQRKVAVLSRGYKRRSRDSAVISGQEKDARAFSATLLGDEPLLILQHLQDGILGVGAERYRVGKKLLEQHPVDLFLLDDGFQHRRLQRDLDICLIDVSRWSAHPFLWPFSYLRDSKGSLRRADCIILTKFEKIGQRAGLLKTFLEKRYGILVMTGELRFQGLRALQTGRAVTPGTVMTRNIAAVCGIANPENYYDLLKSAGFTLGYRKAFPDHHHYRVKDMEEVQRRAASAGAGCLLVTEKDAVKLKSCLKDRADLLRNIYVVEVIFQFSDEAKILAQLQKVLERSTSVRDAK